MLVLFCTVPLQVMQTVKENDQAKPDGNNKQNEHSEQLTGMTCMYIIDYTAAMW